MIEPFQNTYVLTGPTGSGKSELGLRLAERLGAEIISMDSMALYRGMDIGTAKPTPKQQKQIRHHLIDVLDPWESASVAWWLEKASAACRDIEARKKKVLVCGGTPLYLKALLRGLFDGPPGDPALRVQLEKEADERGSAALHARLVEVDPTAAARLHPNDRRRIIRALEVWERTGKPISEWQTQWGDTGWVLSDWGLQQQEEAAADTDEDDMGSGVRSLTPFPMRRVLWLDLPRDELYERIDARVHRMFEAGLIDEVKALRALPQPLSREARQALGYQEILDHLDGKASLEETIARIQNRSRHLAKRQLTWFRHLAGCWPVKRELTFVAWGLTMD
jgi:tRNA dimethylallyltransferase